MARKKRRKPRELEEIVYTTPDIREAFEAAFRLYQECESPEGPAVVTDVVCMVGGRWAITCRLISQRGKEAWL